MKLTHLAFMAIAAVSSAQSYADTRNPFDPSSAKARTEKPGNVPGVRSEPPLGQVAPPFPALPPMLPPPLPAAHPPAPAPMPASAEATETSQKKRPKESQLESTAASCQLKVKSESIAAPAYGGMVSIGLQSSSKSCVSAVMVEQTWLEVQELTDPSAIRIAVDANESSTPRQSNIVIANAGRSVTVTLVQEGRTPRAR